MLAIVNVNPRDFTLFLLQKKHLLRESAPKYANLLFRLLKPFPLFGFCFLSLEVYVIQSLI
ncbi:hypothetical protein FDE64_12575 [Vibrio parahaemolyticus]|nr:hypothetical protein [Vibrio parahaemolyticus]MQC30635.1 hypothetical protein [Vibrio parahaemolyticus]